MGGDYAPSAILEGVKQYLQAIPEQVVLVLYGDESAINKAFDAPTLRDGTLEIVPTTEVILMGEHPTKAITAKPNSSIAVGFSHLRNGKIDAFAGAGNTGAMLVGGMYSVKTLPGVIRPAIASMIPKEKGGYGVLLDVGANADCRPDSLYQFGILGSIYAKEVIGIAEPKVGLINIGEEEEKGNLLSQAAHKIMQEMIDKNFVGNIEGRDLFNTKADVMVCDGFVGNVLLKNTESFYRLILKRGIKDAFFDRFNYEDYGGSPILGLNKPVVIGHGISNAKAISNMIDHAVKIGQSQLIDAIRQAFN